MKGTQDRVPPAADDLAPVFVIGNPRSGTTMLRLVLTAHSAITIPPECPLIAGLFPRYGHIGRFRQPQLESLLEDISGRIIDLAEQWQVPLTSLVGDRERLLNRSYAQICASLYRSYPGAKGLAPTRLWGDKNTAHANYVDVLSWLYPNARFVHIVRDGRAVLASYKALNVDPAQRYAPRLPKEAATVAARWASTVDRIERHLSRFAPERHATVRYEDILSDFDGSVSGLCEFLGLAYEPEMRRFDEANVKGNLEPESFTWKAKTREPLDPSRSEAWRCDLGRNEIVEFESLAGNILRRHGYACASDAKACRLPLRFRTRSRLAEAARGLRRQVIRARTVLGA